MTRQILLGTVAALLIAGPVSALTMIPTADIRVTEAHAIAGDDDVFNSDNPSPPFSIFESKVGAEAMGFAPPALTIGDAEYNLYGPTADAFAGQVSQIGALYIQGSGSVSASGDHGGMPQLASFGESDSMPGYGSFQAYARSALEVLFSIDESAEFDLSGFLASGNELAVGDVGNDVMSSAGMILKNTDTDTTIFEVEISDDTQAVSESGVIDPGNYQFLSVLSPW